MMNGSFVNGTEWKEKNLISSFWLKIFPRHASFKKTIPILSSIICTFFYWNAINIVLV